MISLQPLDQLDPKYREVVSMAQSVRERAYAPYSGYLVGCAVLADNGKIYLGANVENAAYPSALCAEATAVAAMVSDGSRAIRVLVVASRSETPVFPCGKCRQVIREFGAECSVLVVGRSNLFAEVKFPELYPHSFGPKEMGQPENGGSPPSLTSENHS
jgi:cytidine deaminase